MADRTRPVYEGARTEELEEPLLPRWFVLLAIGMIPVALGVAVWAFIVFGPEEVPVAERRPPDPDLRLTTDVGQYNIGETAAVPLQFADCQFFRGIHAGGSELDRERIQTAMTVLCDARPPTAVVQSIATFARQRGVIRFAQFQATGVDSTLDLGADVPLILLNARFSREDTDALWIAPLVAHDTAYLELPAGRAESEVEARTRELAVCDLLLSETRPSRACDDAAAVLDLLDPVRALQAAGFE